MCQVSPITLYGYQVQHKDRLMKILKKTPCALDFSMLGTGKTYTTCAIFNENSNSMFKCLLVISPVSVKTKWQSMNTNHGVNIHKIISFCELRSVKFKQPKHGLLTRRDYMVTVQSGRDIEKVDYYCSNEYIKLVNDGVLLVIDEIQNVKNQSNQLEACKELIRPIVEQFNQDPNKCKSRVILLSGSPIDKQDQVVNMCQLLNIMTDARLAVYNPQTNELIWRGMSQIEQFCKKHFGDETVNRTKGNYISYSPSYVGQKNATSKLHECCYNMFQLFIKKAISSSMDPIQISVNIIKQNAYYQMDNEKDIVLLKQGIDLLSNATHFNSVEETVDWGTNGIGVLRSVVRALTMIETSKINLFAKIAQHNLENSPNMKIVICVNYTDTITDLMNILSKYLPLKLDGSMNYKKRIDVLSKFQAKDTKYRLLIGNISVCSSGIDLDDQDGNFPRLCLVSPNYSTITLYQLSHRFHRQNTKSDSTIHFVFAQQKSEVCILNALAKKSTVMKEVTENQADNGVIFPGDYEKCEISL